ncbi:MAG: lysine 2,3-aminomutase [Planctomycetes bacterium]|nr:lysine 2,3-aminomutase [Planctomycetota bacterium]
MVRTPDAAPAYRVYTRKDIDRVPELMRLSVEDRMVMKAVSAVLPFRVNNHVVETLIDWDDVPGDRIYQLTFPQPGMLEDADLHRMLELVHAKASEDVIKAEARKIQMRLNPHPAGQLELNVPTLDDEPVAGVQHKYKQTVLFFPSSGQTCHAYCSYCFRWAQFVGLEDLKFAARESNRLVEYLRAHKEVTSVLITGGDPMIMKTALLRRYIEPILRAGLDHVTSIRIGTKALAFWPYRFTSGDDADDLMRLFGEIRDAGKGLALMAHYSHPRELEPASAQAAIRRVIDAGATVRCQAPLIRHVNDNHHAWANMWKAQVRLGAVPYYMFVERDTGACNYFEVPLARAYRIFTRAYNMCSGLERTVRGPSMSATPGKVLVDGITRIADEDVFSLRFVQGRNPDWVNRPFHARFDPHATWLDDLEPAFGADEFFFEAEMRKLRAPSPFSPTV